MRLYKRVVAKKSLPQVPMWSILVCELFNTSLFDPRFTGSAETIRTFEEDVYERSKIGTSEYSTKTTAKVYNMHPDDIKDIILKYEQGGA